MRVKAIKSFAGRLPNGKLMSVALGDTLILPKGADWVKAGFVEEVKVKPRTRKPKANAK